MVKEKPGPKDISKQNILVTSGKNVMGMARNKDVIARD